MELKILCSLRSWLPLVLEELLETTVSNKVETQVEMEAETEAETEATCLSSTQPSFTPCPDLNKPKLMLDTVEDTNLLVT